MRKRILAGMLAIMMVLCSFSVPVKAETVSGTFQVKNNTEKTITGLYFSYNSDQTYDTEFLSENNVSSFAPGQFISGVSFDYDDSTVIDVYVKCSDGSEYEARGLSFAEVPTSGCTISIATSYAAIYKNGVINSVNWTEKKAADTKTDTSDTSSDKEITASFTVQNNSSKKITALYFSDSQLSEYTDEFLTQNNASSLANGSSLSGNFTFYSTTKFDVYVKFSDGSEYEAKSLSFAKATKAGGIISITSGTVTLKSRSSTTYASAKLTQKAAATATITATFKIINKTGKKITKLYIADNSTTSYSEEYLSSHNYAYWSNNKYLSVKFEFTTSGSADFRIQLEDGSEYEARGLSFAKATSAGGTINFLSNTVQMIVNGSTTSVIDWVKITADSTSTATDKKDTTTSSATNTTTTTTSKPKLSATKLTLKVGASKTLKVSGTKDKVTWSSSNKKIATVSSSGKVKAKKAGTVTIKAKVNGKTLSCKITVKKK